MLLYSRKPEPLPVPTAFPCEIIECIEAAQQCSCQSTVYIPMVVAEDLVRSKVRSSNYVRPGKASQAMPLPWQNPLDHANSADVSQEVFAGTEAAHANMPTPNRKVAAAGQIGKLVSSAWALVLLHIWPCKRNPRMQSESIIWRLPGS